MSFQSTPNTTVRLERVLNPVVGQTVLNIPLNENGFYTLQIEGVGINANGFVGLRVSNDGGVTVPATGYDSTYIFMNNAIGGNFTQEPNLVPIAMSIVANNICTSQITFCVYGGVVHFLNGSSAFQHSVNGFVKYGAIGAAHATTSVNTIVLIGSAPFIAGGKVKLYKWKN